MTLEALWDWVGRIGLPGVLVAMFVWCLYTRKLRWNAEFEDLRTQFNDRLADKQSRNVELTEELREAREMLANGQRVASRSLDIASTKRER
jgi:hypothetical protein